MRKSGFKPGYKHPPAPTTTASKWFFRNESSRIFKDISIKRKLIAYYPIFYLYLYFRIKSARYIYQITPISFEIIAQITGT